MSDKESKEGSTPVTERIANHCPGRSAGAVVNDRTVTQAFSRSGVPGRHCERKPVVAAVPGPAPAAAICGPSRRAGGASAIGENR
ncbi:hypothetical protein FRAAL6817 [Frankia alni ACN14a]|uniref:Uncharacterized protein n=1 Tax=Frankia alni (strain DSM 45986 / CECT 9034 / ACN14a) TaxID=326424 RepID=Q0RAV0_FRAAA|nr:hypothetical protein FRAAL6817 [Frankia alni ACN14a]